MIVFVFRSDTNYLLGSGENVNIDVKVENIGEDAFEAAYYLQLPPGVTYAKIERLDKENADVLRIYCSVKTVGAEGNSTLKCDLGNPLESSKSVSETFGIKFLLSKMSKVHPFPYLQ